MAIPIQFRKGTAAEWADADPVLFEGELGLLLSDDPDTQLMKMGDGVLKWSELPWASRGPRGFDFAYQWTGTVLGVKTTDEAAFTEVALGLVFDWDGTRLGIKKESDAEFSYVEIRGANFSFEWNGTTLGVKTSDEAEFTAVGLGLQFSWNGYELGIKKEEDVAYTFVDLRGANFEYVWNGTQLGIKTSDEVEYTYTDLKGEKGDTGDQGIQGIQGVQGIQGIQGDQGDKGDTGDPGAMADGKIWVGNSEGLSEERDASPIVLSGTGDPPASTGLDVGTLYFKHE